jgi:hypothetical protein
MLLAEGPMFYPSTDLEMMSDRHNAQNSILGKHPGRSTKEPLHDYDRKLNPAIL